MSQEIGRMHSSLSSQYDVTLMWYCGWKDESMLQLTQVRGTIQVNKEDARRLVLHLMKWIKS